MTYKLTKMQILDTLCFIHCQSFWIWIGWFEITDCQSTSLVKSNIVYLVMPVDGENGWKQTL